MRSRTFLNVSLGILALALVYHLGARSATAQAPASVVAAEGGYVFAANGDVYCQCDNGSWGYFANVFASAGVTESSPLAAAIYGFGATFAVTESGNAYVHNGDRTWTAVGNIFTGGPTPTTAQETFGSLKARYRGERESQGVKPSTGR